MGKLLFSLVLCPMMCFFSKEKPLPFKCILNKFSFCTFGPITVAGPCAWHQSHACPWTPEESWMVRSQKRLCLFPFVSWKRIRYRKKLKSLEMILFGFIVPLKSYNQRTVIKTSILKCLPLTRVCFALSREPNDCPSSCYLAAFPCSLLQARRESGCKWNREM